MQRYISWWTIILIFTSSPIYQSIAKHAARLPSVNAFINHGLHCCRARLAKIFQSFFYPVQLYFLIFSNSFVKEVAKLRVCCPTKFAVHSSVTGGSRHAVVWVFKFWNGVINQGRWKGKGHWVKCRKKKIPWTKLFLEACICGMYESKVILLECWKKQKGKLNHSGKILERFSVSRGTPKVWNSNINAFWYSSVNVNMNVYVDVCIN